MKTADRENPNSRDRLCTEPSPWGGKQETPSLIHTGWKVRNFPAVGEVFFLTFPFIELTRTWPKLFERHQIVTAKFIVKARRVQSKRFVSLDSGLGVEV